MSNQVPTSPRRAASGITGSLPHTTRRDKGKGKQRAELRSTDLSPDRPDGSRSGIQAEPVTPGIPLQSMLEEALSTPLTPPSPGTSLELESPSSRSGFQQPSTISPPPKAHHAPSILQANWPRLLSQPARAVNPVAGLAYITGRATGASRAPVSPRAARAGLNGLPLKDYGKGQGETSTAWQRTSRTASFFPDLDPETGLPLSTDFSDLDPSLNFDFNDENESGTSSTVAPSLQLQRTITSLLKTPTRPPKAASSTSYFPSMFSRISLPGVGGASASSTGLARSPSQRSFSSTVPQEDWTSWATGWWSGNKGKVDEMMSEDDRADTVEEEKEKHRRKYRTPRRPMVFCHGLLGFDYIGPASLPPLQISHWRGIREVLESNGVDVLIARVPATSSIKDRAAILETLIAEKYPGQEVNLIGHSMGGLDCRYLISCIRPTKFTPISLTTISTPHRGSPFADYVIDNLIGRERLPAMLSLMETMRLPHSGDGSAFNALGTRAMKQFNAEVVDDDNVSYYSWGASFDPGLLDTFRWPHSVILAKEGPNDGLVSVSSAKWGEYRGTLVGVNHLDLVGWVNHVRYALSGWTGNPITFKPATFYLEIADFLAEQGF